MTMLFQKISLDQKENIFWKRIRKTGQCYTKLQPCSVLQQDFKLKRTFSRRRKKMCNLTFLCSLGDLSTCYGGWAIPVSMQGTCWRFLLKTVQTGFCSSYKQPNLQPKKEIVVLIIKIFETIFFEGNMARFFNIKIFYLYWNFGCFWWIFF